MKFIKHALCAGAIALTSMPALAATLTMDNWRSIYMNAPYSLGGSNENVFIYALHAPRQENLVFSFDVSSLSGATALSDGEITFTVAAGGGGNWTNGSHDIELHQLNAYNSNVDLDNSGSFYRDSADATPGTLQWMDNSGNALANLNYNNSVFDITSGQVSSYIGPLPGDTGSTAPTVGAEITFDINQSVVQSWLDGTSPAMLVIAVDNSPWINGIMFQNDATLTFDSTPVPELAGFAIGLLGLLAAMRRRKA